MACSRMTGGQLLVRELLGAVFLKSAYGFALICY